MNRFTKLLIAALVAAGFAGVTASPAGAVGETIGACLHEQLEITEIAVAKASGEPLDEKLAEAVSKHPEWETEAADIAAANDNDPAKIEKEAEDRYEDCLEAPNPLLPETNEIIWGGFGFFVVFGFLAWKGYPAIKKAMDDRAAKIQADIDSAERQKDEAATILSDYQRQLADARNESGRIIEEARQQADSLRRDLQAKAEADAAEIRTRAQADVDNMVAQAKADLQAQVGELSIQLAEKVVERNLDRDTNMALIDSYIRELESQGS